MVPRDANAAPRRRGHEKGTYVIDLYTLLERLSADLVSTGKSFLIMVHLVGLALGIGAATLLDVFILRFLVLRNITQANLEVVEFATKVVTMGLVMLWGSGVGFLLHYGFFDPAKLMNEKVWAKIGIVMILTINGMFIHRMVLPLIRSNLGRPLFDGLPVGKRRVLLLTGAVSAVSWYVPLMLGSLPQLNFLPAGTILVAYGILLGAAVAVTQSLVGLLPTAEAARVGHAGREAI